MATHYPGTDRERRALDAYIKLVRSTETVGAEVHRHLRQAGLTETQFGVLEALHHLGPLCAGELSGKLLKSNSNLTTVLDNLEKRDLIQRRRGAGDRRYVSVQLTSAASALLTTVLPRHVQGITGRLSVLTPEEQEELGRLCRKLGRATPANGRDGLPEQPHRDGRRRP